jgi:hypothetical protein
MQRQKVLARAPLQAQAHEEGTRAHPRSQSAVGSNFARYGITAVTPAHTGCIAPSVVRGSLGNEHFDPAVAHQAGSLLLPRCQW